MSETAVKFCVICGGTVSVERYGLRKQRRTASGPTSIGAGGIDLCASCHAKHAQDKMRPR